MIITLLIVACVLLAVAVVILFAVLKKQRDEISDLNNFIKNTFDMDEPLESTEPYEVEYEVEYEIT